MYLVLAAGPLGSQGPESELLEAFIQNEGRWKIRIPGGRFFAFSLQRLQPSIHAWCVIVKSVRMH